MKEREIAKILKYKQLCADVGHDFLPVAFEVQGRAGEMFSKHFNAIIKRRAIEIGISKYPLISYWKRRISLALQRNVAMAINVRMSSVYSGPKGALGDESAWEGVIQAQSNSRVGCSGRE